MQRRRLNHTQRVVIVVALGVATYFFGQWIIATVEGGFTGWVGYAPLTSAPFTRAVILHPWVVLLIWLSLIAAWTVASLVILRDHDSAP